MTVLFVFSGLLVMPLWALMIFLPRWRHTRTIIATPWIAAPAALAYVLLVVPQLPHLLPLLVNPRLAPIATLLGSPEGATIAWIHFLAFDLLVGRWVFLDSTERRISPWIVSPILFCVLMVGPLGLLIYLVARQAWPLRTHPLTPLTAMMKSFMIALIAGAGAAAAAPLTVTVASVASTGGTVRVAVYADAATYLDEARAYCKEETPATNGTVSVSFTNAPATACAIAVFHDRNGNKTLDKNMVGSPVEPYGFSNNARGTFGPPTFAKAVVTPDPTNRVVHIRIK